MRTFSLSSVAISLLLAACSSDDRSPDVANGGTTQTSINNNNAAGASGSAGRGNGGSAGAMTGAPTTGGGGTEGGTGNVMLGQGGGATTGTGASGAPGAAGAPEVADAGDDPTMSFFVTSRGSGNGGNFGGIAGADEFCRALAAESSPALSDKTWRAYLSTSTESARSRIGTGPWRNFEGRVIANDVNQLHDQAANGSLNGTWPTGDATVALDELGDQVPNNPVIHDIITGSNLDGTVAAAGTCSDWTAATGTTQNGHSNRAGGGQNPSSWNGSHATGCAEPAPGQNFQMGTVSQGGGRGSIYCFAID